MSTIAQRRLESLKTEAASYNNPAMTWKKVRSWTKPAVLTKGDFSKATDGKSWYTCSLDSVPANLVGDANDIIRLDHTGWFMDSFQDELVKGCVFAIRNPQKRNDDGGHMFYLPAIYCTGFDNVVLYNELYDTAEQAARYADQYAERYAEESREYYAKEQAEQEILDLKTEIHQANKYALELIRDIKANTFPDSVCSAVKDQIYRFLEKRTASKKRIAALQENYWLAVENW